VAGELVLLSIRHDGRGAVHALPRAGSVTIGRGRKCSVRLDASGVSRIHARLQLGDPLSIEDLGSANGTRVGREALVSHSPRAIAVGEVIEMGNVLLVIQQRSSASTGDPETELCSSPAMKRVLDDAARVARGTISVLITGETGVGKDIVAQRIHQLSPRASRPFMRINCAALSESLVDSELFGHERGAFTGAANAKRGLLEAADGGTLFLDEVGELPALAQAKLLHAIEQREFFRVGSVEVRRVDVRFLAATNRNLEQDVAGGRFRQDLFFRLAAAVVRVPPLRERREEILPFSHRFLEDAANSLTSEVPAILPDARAALEAHQWPGNLRELRNTVERALLSSSGESITAAHLQLGASLAPPSATTTSPPSGSPAVDERELIIATLARFGGNQTHAARFLGMSRNTLSARIERHGIARPRKPADKLA
jgi:DNA-binding NtrC family response regulator